MPKDTELEWARANPEPRFFTAGDCLTLWNYPVAGVALAPAHQRVLAEFVSIELSIDPGGTRTQFNVNGHASASGLESANRTLSEGRAEQAAAFLRRLGATAVNVGWAGSNQPVDPGATGLACARNRRVEVFKLSTASPVEPVPLDPVDPAQGEPIPGLGDGGSTDLFGRIDVEFETPAIPVKTALVNVDVKLVGRLTGTLRAGRGNAGAKLILKADKLSGQVEAQVTEAIKGTLGLEPGSGGKPPKLKIGVQMDQIELKPEVGVQASAKMVYFGFTLVKQQLPDVVIGDLTLSLGFTGKLKVDVGPSEALAARLAPLAGPAAAAAPAAGAVGGAVAVCAVINGGVSLLAQDARAGALRHMALLAWRDGVACRVAYEVLGRDVLAYIKSDELELMKFEGDTHAAFRAGWKCVNDLLVSLGTDGRATRSQHWRDTYAKGAGLSDYPDVKRRIYDALGGSQRADTDQQVKVTDL